ncbi:MAG: right-handed parallel beta-helix repeat-containing protein [Verrucomicrobia bacterium]|nr:right-handed parallel beta-helix repeat-containing protein [Verrucomicrobiota bacterium]
MNHLPASPAALLLAAGLAATIAARAAQPSVVEAHTLGYDPADATKALQSAISSGAGTVIVRKTDGPWIVDPIRLASDQEVIFEPGVVVLAKRGSFRGSNDSLFTAASGRNIRLTGSGAVWRMHRWDYDAPPYRKAEWRHTLNLRSCTNVAVAGLTLAESGGDGIYLGVDRSGGPNRNVLIRDVVCDGNYRQGISVISAEGLMIENCVLKNTAGTAPAAGIDFEPNHPGECLVDCVMRGCVSEDNQGLGCHFYLNNLDAASRPLSIRIEDCIFRGTNRQSINVSLPMRNRDSLVAGRIDFVRCRLEEQGHAGITISKPAEGARLRFEDCLLADPAASPALASPIVLQARAGARLRLGGIDFGRLVCREKIRRPLFDYPSGGTVPLEAIEGVLIRELDGHAEPIVLDAAWLAEVSPPNPFFDLAAAPVDWTRLPRPAAWPVVRPLPAHRLRGPAAFALHARADEHVRLVLRFQAVGTATNTDPFAVRVTRPSGQPAAQFAGRLGADCPCQFAAPEAGFYVVRCDPGRHTVTAAASTHPLCVLGQEGLFHWVRTEAAFSFSVPAGSGDFGLQVSGGGGEERAKASLFDPDGRQVWSEDAIGTPRNFIGRASPVGSDRLWQLRLQRPDRGVHEDHYVELRGVPAILFFEPAGLISEPTP